MNQIIIDFTKEYPLHQRHSKTSRASAAKSAPQFSDRLIEMLKFFDTYVERGLTDQEGQDILMMSGDSYRPIRVILAKHNLVADTGMTRKTQTGRSATVWRITGNGILAIRKASNGQ